MATFRITNLRCIKKRDPIGKDEIDIYLAIDGGSQFFLSGPHFIDKSRNDDEVTLDVTRTFDERIVVRLMERDGERGGNNDRDLGTVPFNTSPVSNEFSFNDGGVDYALRCNVTT
ncbi:MAG: hypothetical protein ACRDRR_14890 [Pseudonocardiaceae bacterium]